MHGISGSVAGVPGLELCSYEGVDALRGLVGPLGAAGILPAPTLEMEPDYLAAGFEGDRPSALVAWGEQGPIAYMPFSVRKSRLRFRIGPLTFGYLPYRQLRLLGYTSLGVADEAVLAAFLRELVEKHHWHIGHVFEFPSDNPLSAYLSKITPIRRALAVLCDSFETFRVDIKGSFDAYLKQCFSAKTRNTLRRKLRILNEYAAGQVDVRVYTTPEEVPDFLQKAEHVARQTYQWRLGHTTVRATPDALRTVAHLAQHGCFRSYILFVRGEPCAYVYGTICRRKLDYRLLGYSPVLSKLSPGTVLLYRILEDLFATAVVDELDFGPTFADYKEMFSTAKRAIFNARLYRCSGYAWALHGLENGWDRVRGGAARLARLTRVRNWLRRGGTRMRHLPPVPDA